MTQNTKPRSKVKKKEVLTSQPHKEHTVKKLNQKMWRDKRRGEVEK